MSEELTWYVTRSSGLVAWALLALATLWGLLLSSRVLERRPSPAWLLDLHRHLGWLTLVFSAVHLVALYVDDFVDFSMASLVVPFVSEYETGAVAFGVVAMYVLIAVQITSWLRGRIPRRVWRAVHWLSAPLFIVASIHGLMVGTDTGSPWVAVIGIVLTAEVVLVFSLHLGGRRRMATI